MNDSTYMKDLTGRLRDENLPRSPWGFRPAATRMVLEEAARRLESLHAENTRLRLDLNRREREAAELSAAPVEEKDDPRETISRALLAAARSADELLAEAREESEHMVRDARAEAEAIVRRAREAAEEATAHARNGLASMREQGRRLLTEVTELRDFVAAFCEEAEPREAGVQALGVLRLPTEPGSPNGDGVTHDPQHV